MKRVSGILKLHAKDKFFWLVLPISALLPAFAVNLIMSLATSSDAGTSSGGLAFYYITIALLGISTLIKTFPCALGFSARRTDYFLGTTIIFVAVSAITAILLMLLSVVEGNLTAGWGVGLHFFRLTYVSDGPVIEQLWTTFVLLLHMYFLGFVIACVLQRFERNGLIALLAILLVFIVVLSFAWIYGRWWGIILDWRLHHSTSVLTPWLLLPLAVYVLASYALLRKATV